MLGTITASAALLRAHNHRDGYCTTRHITKLGSLIDDLIRCNKCEIHEQQFHYRPHPSHRCTNAEAHKTGLADGSIAHTVGAELVDQILGHAKDAAVVADIFAHQEDARIGTHLFTEGLI